MPQGKTNFNFRKVEIFICSVAMRLFNDHRNTMRNCFVLYGCTSTFSLALITFWRKAQAGRICQKRVFINISTWSLRRSFLSVCTTGVKSNSWKYDLLLRQQIHFPKKTGSPFSNMLSKVDIQYEPRLIKRNDIENYVMPVFAVFLCWYHSTVSASKSRYCHILVMKM